MSCQICGRSSAPGAKLCPDCRAARKRAYDATITQPLFALAGAGTVSRTLSRLRRDSSPEAKARRAARKAKAAANAATPATVSEAAAAPHRFSRSILWAVLAIGVVVAAIAGWHLPTRAPEAPDVGVTSSATPAGVPQPAPDAAARTNPLATSTPAALPPLPTIVERELVPHAPAAVKPVTPKRANPAPKAVSPAPEAPAEVEIVKAQPAPAPPVPQPPVRVDPWQQMSQAIGRCPAEFLGRVVCEQKVRLQYCEGQWGKAPQCPGGPSVDHD
jgi:hypothetical protein